MARRGISKLALINNEELQKKCILDWSLPNETLLMSAMDNEVPNRTFVFVNKDDQAVKKT
jgi:hypothetical protein